MPFNPIDQAAPAFVSANAAALAAQGYANNAAASATAAASSAISAANPVKYDYSTNSSTSSSLALVAGDIQLTAQVGHTLSLTGAITAASNAQLPTVAALVAGWGGTVPVEIGQTFVLRARNTGGSGAGSWTFTTNTGWTLNGNVVIPPNSHRDFEILFSSLTTATLYDIGVGHYAPPVPVDYSANSSTSSTTSITAADIQVLSAFGHVLSMTGAISGASEIILPTVASVVAAWGTGVPVVIGQTYVLRIINTGGTSSGVWTLTVDAGPTWTLNGTKTIAVGAWRDFLITFTSLTAASVQSIGAGVI